MAAEWLELEDESSPLIDSHLNERYGTNYEQDHRPRQSSPYILCLTLDICVLLSVGTLCGVISALIAPLNTVFALKPVTAVLLFERSITGTKNHSTNISEQLYISSSNLQHVSVETLIICFSLGLLQFSFNASNPYINMPDFSNMNKIRDALENNLPQALTLCSTMFFSTVICFIIRWDVTLVLLLVAGPAVCLIFIGTKRSVVLISEEQSWLAKAAQISGEAFMAIKTVICFNGQNNVIERYNSAVQQAMHLSTKRITSIAVIDAFKTFLLDAVVTIGITYGGVTVSDQDVGALIALIFLATRNLMMMVLVNMNINALLVAVASAKQIGRAFDMKSENSTAGQVLAEIGPQIIFSHVTFAYPSREETPVLRDICLKMFPGQHTALVGESGCGKSTLVALLLRLFDTSSGVITIDGHPLASLNLKWLRTLFGYVGQQPLLFGMSIRENMLLCNPIASADQITRALELSNALDFVMQLSEGLDTQVGERGTQLSGGQRQRLAIARAVLRDPPIMIFDEATSSLDSESERLVQAAIDKISENRVCITIAHRLSTVLGADYIVVMDKGTIVEQGVPDKLFNSDSIFRRMLERQNICALDLEKLRTPQKKHNFDQGIGNEKFENETHAESGFVAQQNRSIISTVSEMASLHAPSIACSITTLFTIGVRTLRAVGFVLAWTLLVEAFVYPYDIMVRRLATVSIVYMLLAFLSLAGEIGLFITITKFADQLSSNIRASLLVHFLHENLDYFERAGNQSGVLNAKLSTHAANIRETLSSKVPDVLTDSTASVFCLIVAFWMEPRLACISSGLNILLLALRLLELAALLREENQLQPLLQKTNAIATEAVANLETIKAFGMERQLCERYMHQYAPVEMQQMKRVFVNSCLVSTANSLVGPFTIGISIAISSFLMSYDSSLTTFAVFGSALVTATAFWRLHLLLTQTRMLARAIASCNAVADILETGTHNHPTIHREIVHISFDGDIQFENVQFAFSSRPSSFVLKDFNLTIATGCTTALVGPSGAGKSSVLDLILGLYQSNGRVSIGGFGISEIDAVFLHRHIVPVNQEPTLFNMSIWDNITYGIEGVSPQNVYEAATDANIHDFVTSLPQGYETEVGPLGAKLSGGQKARLAIARAIVRQPQVLLLDEATCALDTRNEQLVHEALENIQHKCTCIMVAHRLSTVKNANKIVVLANGQIVEMAGYPERIRKIRNFQFEPDDIVIASYPKSGTMWTAELVSCLLYDANLEIVNRTPMYQRAPILEFDFPDQHEGLTEIAQSRAFVTHLLWPFLPKQLQENKCKMIYVSRNPKDVAVSFYHFHKISGPVGYQDMPWDNFFKLFNAGEIVCGSWFDHVLDFYKHNKKDKQYRVLFIKYEDLIKNFDHEFDRILKFMDKELSDDKKAEIKEHCRFGSMAHNPNSHLSDPELFDQSIGNFMRKGVIGDWKNHFTQEQNQIFDKMYKEKMVGSNLNYDFE